MGCKKKKEATGSVSEVGISEQQETVESPTSAPIQPPQEETSFGSDLIKSWNQGRAQAQSIDDVLKIVTQGREVSDTELNNYIKAVQEIQSIGTTEGMQQFQKEYEEGGKDVGSFILALGKNLDVIPEVVASSIASMIAPDVAVGAGIGAVGGAATGAGLTAIGGPLALFGAGAGGIGGAVAGGTAVLEGTLSFTEFLQEELAEQGLDFTPEGIRSVLESEEAISNIKNRALKRGVAIGLVEALTFGLANKVGGKLARGVGTPALLKSAGAQTVIEGTGGGVGESVGRAVAGQEQDVADIGLEFFAELPGATLSGATTLFKRPKYTIKGETGVINRVSQDQFIKFIEKATPEELISANLQAVNDQKVSNVLDAKMEEAQLKVNLKKAYPDLSEENLNKLVPLQKRLTDLKNNPVDTEDVQKTVKEQINQITNAVQKPSPTEVDVSQPSQDSPTVGEGDTQGTAVTRETETVETDQTTEPAQESEVETEVSETEEVETVDTPAESTVTEEDFVELKILADPDVSVKNKNNAFNKVVGRLTKKGKTLTRTAAALIKKVKTLDVNDPVGVKNVLDKINKVFTDADTKQKIDKAKSLQNKISKQTKNLKDNSMVMAAKEFVLLDPFLSDNLDAFIKQAETINKGLGKSTIGKDKVKIKTPFNIKQAQSFVLKQQKIEQKLKQQEQNQAYELLTGLSSKDATLEDVRKALRPDPNTTPAQQERAQKKIEKNKAKIEKGVQKAFNNFKKAALGRIKKPINQLTPSQKNIIRDFINIDIDKLETTNQKLEAIDGLVNFAVNESTGGMQSVVAKYNGIVEAQKLKQEGISAKSFKFIGNEFLGSKWLKWMASTPNAFDLIFKSQSKARKAMKAMGLSSLTRSAATATRLTNNKINQYVENFKTKKANGERYFSQQNTINRGLLAFMRRTVDGTPAEQKSEFERRKKIVEETISTLNNSSKKEFNNQGKLYDIAYKKLLAANQTIESVESNADPINLEGVEAVTETWRELRPDLQETGLNVYNMSLGEDVNYTPDNYSVIEQTTQEQIDFDKPFFNPSDTDYVYSKETGRLIPSKRPTSLKGKDKTRIVNLSFDTLYNRTLKDAYMDINIAPSIQQINGFRSSKFFNDIFPDQSTREIINDAINDYVAAKRSKLNIKGEDVKAIKSLNRLASIGVARALAGVTQPLKQLSPFMTTIANAGTSNTLAGIRLLSEPAVKQSLNKLGAGINLRGIESEASLERENKIIENMSNSKGVNIDGLYKLSDEAIKQLLVKPDVFTAKASFLSYYLQGLENQGVDINSLEWKNHNWNTDAVDFAQNQVDRQQNVSDPDLQGLLFRGKNLGTQILRKILFPFANFVTNQKTRMYADIVTLRNNPLPEERKAAVNSLIGLVGEAAYFNFLTYGIAQALNAMSYGFMDEDETEEEAEKTKRYNFVSRAGNVLSDIAVPIPVLDDIVKENANSFIDAVFQSDDPIQFFVKNEKDLIDQLGTLGIGIKEIAQAKNLILPGVTGVLKREYRGNKSEKKLTKEQQQFYLNSGLAYLAYSAGLLPAEIKRFINTNIRILTKSPQTINKTLLKKINPELYNDLYGPGSASYNLKQLKKEFKK